MEFKVGSARTNYFVTLPESCLTQFGLLVILPEVVTKTTISWQAFSSKFVNFAALKDKFKLFCSNFCAFLLFLDYFSTLESVLLALCLALSDLKYLSFPELFPSIYQLFQSLTPGRTRCWRGEGGEKLKRGFNPWNMFIVHLSLAEILTCRLPLYLIWQCHCNCILTGKSSRISIFWQNGHFFLPFSSSIKKLYVIFYLHSIITLYQFSTN